jgi:hypothetical protein
MFRKLTFRNWQTAESQCKCHRENSGPLKIAPLCYFDQTKSIKFALAAENGFILLLWWCPFRIKKEKLVGLQFTSTDYLSLVLNPLRIRWTVPLRSSILPSYVHHPWSRYLHFDMILLITLSWRLLYYKSQRISLTVRRLFCKVRCTLCTPRSIHNRPPPCQYCSLPLRRVHEIKHMYLDSCTLGLFIT